MREGAVSVPIRVLDRELTVAVREDQRDELLACADYLNARVAELKRSARVVGSDRLVLLAALNLAQELLAVREELAEVADGISRCAALEKRLTAALAEA